MRWYLSLLIRKLFQDPDELAAPMRCAPSPFTSLAVRVRVHTCVHVQLVMAADTVARNPGQERDPEEKSIRGVLISLQHTSSSQRCTAGHTVGLRTHVYRLTCTKSLMQAVSVAFAYILAYRAVVINHMNSLITSAGLLSSLKSAYRK